MKATTFKYITRTHTRWNNKLPKAKTIQEIKATDQTREKEGLTTKEEEGTTTQTEKEMTIELRKTAM